MARLDRLGPAKDIAQIGAAIGREFSHALLAALAGKPETELQSALNRLTAAGLLFRQGVPPHASYLFKHALIQDAAYGTLLREPRRALHSRVADLLESQFPEVAENQPELLARHCTEDGLIEKAASLWGKAGHRSLARSALIEAAEQLTRALDQIGTLPSTRALRREQIKFQVALITPLMHVKGYASSETRAAAERADLHIKQARALEERPDDPLLLFSVLYGVRAANLVAFNGDILRELSTQFLSLAEDQVTTAPRSMAQRMIGTSLLFSGEFAPSRAHLERAFDALRSSSASPPCNAVWLRY
jgi:predicted ATPase